MLFDTVAIVGASGNVGALLGRTLRPHVRHLAGLDLHACGESGLYDTFFITDGCAPVASAGRMLAESDCVVMATPLDAGLAATRAMLGLLAPGTLFVDTFSVKTQVCTLLAEQHHSWEHLSINPMFAPAVGFAGQNVAAVADRTRTATESLLAILEGLGARVVVTSAADHDRTAAIVQAATHFLILTLGRLLAVRGEDIERSVALSSPPYRMCLAILARIATGNPDAYWDVQAHNVHAAGARRDLLIEAAGFSALVDVGDRPAFERTLNEIADALGAHAGPLADLSAVLVRQT